MRSNAPVLLQPLFCFVSNIFLHNIYPCRRSSLLFRQKWPCSINKPGCTWIGIRSHSANPAMQEDVSSFPSFFFSYRPCFCCFDCCRCCCCCCCYYCTCPASKRYGRPTVLAVVVAVAVTTSKSPHFFCLFSFFLFHDYPSGQLLSPFFYHKTFLVRFRFSFLFFFSFSFLWSSRELPDEPFQNLRASRSGDHQVQECRVTDFEAPKNVKGFVG